MKGFRLKIYLLSIFFLILISSIYFYKNIILLNDQNKIEHINIQDLMYFELKIDRELFILSSSFKNKQNNNHEENIKNFNLTFEKFLELYQIFNNIEIEIKEKNIDSKELLLSIEKINQHFKLKIERIKKFKSTIINFNSFLNDFKKVTKEIEALPLKSILFEENFYSKSYKNIMNYLVYIDEANFLLIEKDLIRLNQILAFSTSPLVVVEKYKNVILGLANTVKDLIQFTNDFEKKELVYSEYIYIENYIKIKKANQRIQSEVLTKIMFTGLLIYLLALIFLIKKGFKK